VQMTQNLNGHPLFCMFLADEFSRCSAFSASHYASTIPSFRCQRLKLHEF